MNLFLFSFLGLFSALITEEKKRKDSDLNLINTIIMQIVDFGFVRIWFDSRASETMANLSPNYCL